MIINLECGHIIERESDFFQPEELCPVGDGWQHVMNSEVVRISEATESNIETSLSDEVTKALDSAKPSPEIEPIPTPPT